MSNDNSSGSLMAALIGGFLFLTVIGSCNSGANNSSAVVNKPPQNDYQDMRNRGHSEEDAIIFGILKQQGYSDYDAINATKSSKR